MSFYGSISNAGKTALTFDKIYPNRKAMEKNCIEDGVFIGRCVLVEYDDNTFAYLTGFMDTGLYGYPQLGKLYNLYVDQTKEHTYRIDASPKDDGYALKEGALVRAKLIDIRGNLVSKNDTFFFVCEGRSDEKGAALFSLVDSSSNEYITDYDLNYLIDKNFAEEEKYPFSSGWDSTVWQKVAEDGAIRYKMIASLNSELPTFTVRPEAPSIDPVAPHFGQNSTNMTYTLHMPTTWGFKVKNIKDAGEKENLYSDEKVIYKLPESQACDEAIPVKHDYVDEKNARGKDDDDDKIEDNTQGNPDLNGIPYDGAIFYNKAGFNKLNRSVSNAENVISVLPTGFSSRYPDYYVHDENTLQQRKPDMQELTIQLPAIGNAVSELWDLLYGDKDADGNYLKTRNDNIEWNDTSGIRMVQNDLDNGGFIYLENKTESLAGAINSLHDAMGMIIATAPAFNETKEEALDRATSNKIYFGALGDNENQKGFYYKDTEYKFEPFATIPDLNERYKEAGKPLPFPDFNPENLEDFIKSKTYYNLTQFEANKYYTYVDNNFYIDANNVPTPDTTYYQLGEPLEVKLKEWHEEVIVNPETGKTEEEKTFYELEGDYIQDTNEVTDETKQYFSVTLTKETFPAGHKDTGTPRLIWNPKRPIECKDSRKPENANAMNAIDFSTIIFDPDDLAQTTLICKDGYFYMSYEGDNAITLAKVEVTDTWDPQKQYYKIPMYAIKQVYDIENKLVEIPHFINAAGALISFEDAVSANTRPTEENAQNLFGYDKYRVNYIDFISNYYFSESEFDVLLSDGTVKKEFGYKLLNSKNDIDDNVIYYSIIKNYLTTERPAEEELIPPEEGEKPDEPNDIYFTHYYKPGVYYFKNSTNDYILSTSNTFNSELTYYLLTNKDTNKELEKNPETGLFIIEPETAKFYEPNKYYYYSIEFDSNLMDTSSIMKKFGDDDVHPDYFEEKTLEDGSTKKLVYFIPQKAYVVNDTAGILNKGMVWDKSKEPPKTVTLGGRYSEPKWTELKGFSRTLNTINGLILQLNKYFKFDDKYIRDNSTVQGCLNQLNDIINLTNKLNPGNIIVIDDYGRMSGASLSGIAEDSKWIDASVKTEANRTAFSLDHILPSEVELKTIRDAGVTNVNFGGTINLTNFKLDEMGHIHNAEQAGITQVTLPKLTVNNVSMIESNAEGDSATEGNTIDANVVTSLSVSADGQSIEANKINAGDLTVSSGNSLNDIDEAVTLLKADNTTEGSVAFQIAKIINDNDATDLDTLEEIAAWITSDTTGATAMNADIVALKNLVGNTAVATQISNAINAALKIDNVDKYALASELIALSGTVDGVDARVKTLEGTITAEKITQWNSAEVNVQSDWNVTDTTSDAFILNKPDLSNYITNNQKFVYKYDETTSTDMTIQELLTYIASLEARIKVLENATSTPTT